MADAPPDDGLDEGNYLVSLGALTQGDTGGPNTDAANLQYDQLVIDGGFDNVLFFLSDTGLLLRNGVAPLASPFVLYDTTSDLVDYRLRLERERVRLFANGSEVVQLDREALPLSGSANDRSTLRLGDISTTDSGSSQIERFSIARFGPPASVVRNYEYDTVYSANDSSGPKSVFATCPAGTTALTGGASTLGAEGDVGISESRPGPESPPTTWHGSAREIDDVMFYDRRISGEELENMAGCGRMIGPSTLNLDASLFASPSDDQHGLCVYFEAGNHDLTLVDPAIEPDARFRGWSPTANGSWGTTFRVDPELEAGFSFGLPIGEASAQAAFDTTLVIQTTLTLSARQRVYFSFEEDVALDNRGGVSIRLLPEPGIGMTLLGGGLLLRSFARRRAAFEGPGSRTSLR